MPDKGLLRVLLHVSTEEMVWIQTTILSMAITCYSSMSFSSGTLGTNRVESCLFVETEMKTGVILSAETEKH